MKTIRFLQLDVFAERAGGGNPLGVVIGADGWSDARMQAFAAWADLVETTFVLPASDATADYRVRIFTPTREIPFAGHPSIGTAHAVLSLEVAVPREGRLIQQCGAGLLPLRIQQDGDVQRIAVQSPAARCLRAGTDVDPQLVRLLAALPTGPTPPALIEGGRRWWVAEVGDVGALRGYHPNHSAIATLARATDALGLTLFARHADGMVVRAFPCGVGIDEDPASGAANGLIASWLRQNEPDGSWARGYRVSQGREIGHDARIDIAIDVDGTVWVGGRVHTVIDGRLLWPS